MTTPARTIGRVATLSGVPTKTIRYYEESDPSRRTRREDLSRGDRLDRNPIVTRPL